MNLPQRLICVAVDLRMHAIVAAQMLAQTRLEQAMKRYGITEDDLRKGR